MFEVAIQQWVEDWTTRRSKADKLDGLKDPNAIEPMIDRLLHDQDFKVRGAVAAALGRLQIGDAPVIKALALAVADANGSVGEEARVALDGIDKNWPKSQGALEAVPALIERLQSQESYARAQAAITLGKIGDRRAITALAMMTGSDPDPMNRVDAGNALNKIDPNWRRSYS